MNIIQTKEEEGAQTLGHRLEYERLGLVLPCIFLGLLLVGSLAIAIITGTTRTLGLSVFALSLLLMIGQVFVGLGRLRKEFPAVENIRKEDRGQIPG